MKYLYFFHNKKKIKFDENTLIEQAFDLLNNSNNCSNTIEITVTKHPYCDEFLSTRVILFLILLIQYTFITMFVWIGFAVGWNETLKYGTSGFNAGMIICSIYSFIACIFLACILADKVDEKENISLNLCFTIFYIPMMIIFCFLFSSFIDKKYILSFLFVIFFNLLINVIFLPLIKCEFFPIFTLLFCVISDILTILPFFLFWFDSDTATENLSIIAACIAAYITACSCYPYDNKDKIATSFLIFNYGLFLLGYGITIGIIAGIIWLIVTINNECK